MIRRPNGVFWRGIVSYPSNSPHQIPNPTICMENEENNNNKCNLSVHNTGENRKKQTGKTVIPKEELE